MTIQKERPIIFSGPMVRAILAGRKTQTRRVVKPVRGYEHNSTCRPDLAADPWVVWWHGESERVGCLQACPFGAPGDLLWVKETWSIDNCGWRVSIAAEAWPSGWPVDRISYIASSSPTVVGREWNTRSCSSMPRWASRLTLEVVSVRAELLQEISEADAAAEGCVTRTYVDGRGVEPATLDFRTGWDRLNGKRAPWASNPWVWVVEFKVAS